jgi:hypothetical protein
MDIHDQSTKVYIVLGMHKSGTSFISKALFDQGVQMTTLDDHSFRRHYEDLAFLDLDKEMLHSAGGYWRKPPTEEEMQKVGFIDRIKEIIAKQTTKFWGWKDPRNAFTAPKFIEQLKEEDVYLVCVFRKPQKVQESLIRAKGEGDYRDLIKEYNRRILKTVKDFVGLD